MSNALIDDYSTVPLSVRKGVEDKRTSELSELLRLAHSPEEGKAEEAALKLWELMNNLNEEEVSNLSLQTSISGPLAHILSKFVESKNRSILLYASRTLKSMMRDDKTRQTLCKSGIGRALSMRLNALLTESSQGSSNREIRTELFAAAQNILYDEQTAPDFASSGGLRAIGECLIHSFSIDEIERGGDPEVRTLLLACAANALSHSDTCLSGFTHEMRGWIEPLSQGLSKMKIPQDSIDIEYTCGALANATRDPGLVHALRAVNGAEALERCRHGDPKAAEAAKAALSKLQFVGGLNHENKVWRFRWGGTLGVSSKKMTSQQVLGMVAFLFAVSAIAGIVILIVFHLLHQGAYF